MNKELRKSAYWVHVVASVIMNKFSERGFASDHAWRELFDGIELWVKDPSTKKDLIQTIEFTFGMDEDALMVAVVEADAHLTELDVT